MEYYLPYYLLNTKKNNLKGGVIYHTAPRDSCGNRQGLSP